MVPHQPGWQFDLSPSILPDVPPGEVRQVTLTGAPPLPGQPLLPDDTPVVDVEALNGNLIGGFRKTLPPTGAYPHSRDPIYADRK